MNQLIKIEKPELPIDWDYEKSIGKVKELLFKWKNLTIELMQELWIARENLSEHGGDRKSDQRKKSSIESWTQYCQAAGSSRQVINRSLKRFFGPFEQQEIPFIELPLGEFRVTVSDPPWPYGTKYDPDTRRIASPYPERSLEDITNQKPEFADPSVLWLWTTHKFLFDANEILKEWGFDYKLTFVWNKESIGMGQWLRCQAEFCLLGVKGGIGKFWDLGNQRDIISEKRREHSTKPDTFYEMVEVLCPGPSDKTFYLEMYARQERKGWAVWGNEI